MNNICAIPAAVPAMLPNPKTPATIAINKNINDQPNITFLSFVGLYSA